MISVKFELKGTPAMIARLNNVKSREHREARDALEDGGNMFLAYSDTIIPMDTGALMESKASVETKDTPRTIERVIGYGAPAAAVNPKSGVHPGEYAVIQHETPFAHKGARSWKYLEFSLYRRLREYMDILRQRLHL